MCSRNSPEDPSTLLLLQRNCSDPSVSKQSGALCSALFHLKGTFLQIKLKTKPVRHGSSHAGLQIWLVSRAKHKASHIHSWSQFYAIGLPSSDNLGSQKKFHVFPIMKGSLQCSEEIKGELPFFMPAHLLAVGSQREWRFYEDVLIHTHTPAVKLHLQLVYWFLRLLVRRLRLWTYHRL